MAFVKIPGLAGKLFVPDEKPQTEKKHDCKDCYSCQQCPDDRCRLCRQERRRKESDPDRKMPHRCARHERVSRIQTKS